MNRYELMQTIAPNTFGVEVGVLEGEFSESILKCNPRKLLLVDAWKHFSNGYDDVANVNQGGQDDRYRRVVQKFQPYPNVEIVRCLSRDEQLAPILKKNLQWAYIDANHAAEECYLDMCFYAQYTTVLAMHDYLPHDNSFGFGVRLAVERFVSNYNWRVTMVTKEEFPTALIVKI